MRIYRHRVTKIRLRGIFDGRLLSLTKDVVGLKCQTLKCSFLPAGPLKFHPPARHIIVALCSCRVSHPSPSPSPQHINNTAPATRVIFILRTSKLTQVEIMASNNKATGLTVTASTITGERSYFETQRAALLGEIGVVSCISHTFIV